MLRVVLLSLTERLIHVVGKNSGQAFVVGGDHVQVTARHVPDFERLCQMGPDRNRISGKVRVVLALHETYFAPVW